MMDNNSTVKQVSRIDYIGPHQIQTTSVMSVNFSTRIENCDFEKSICKPITHRKRDSNGLKVKD